MKEELGRIFAILAMAYRATPQRRALDFLQFHDVWQGIILSSGYNVASLCR